MPIYEYRCSNCHRKVSIFWRTISAVDESKARCNFCGSARLNRLASRVRVIRGGSNRGGADTGTPDAGGDIDDSVMNEMSGLDENDPRQLGRFMRKMAAQTGEDMGPEFDEIVGRLEKGEDPEKIEQSMGDLFGEPGGGDMMDDEMMPPPQPESSAQDEPAGEGEAGKKPAKGGQAEKKTASRPVRAKTPKKPATGRATKGKARTKAKTK
ncbi:MAG: zinc ribbon domain-containing protein [Chloroflexi bacterium]|nr:zinc ribbon domain-containing protein [Chloroflexota bacterium]